MFFRKKTDIRFIKFKPEELDARTEWLFWSSLIHTIEVLDNLKNIFGVDDYNWSFHKKDALFETLLWQFGSSIAVLKEKLLTDEQIVDLTSHLIFFLEIIFPTYKHYEIIDILSPYIVFARQEQEPKKLKDELEGQFIQRICKLFNIDQNNINNDLREFISIKFPFGWMLGFDAFTTVKIEDIENGNLRARQMFREDIVKAQEICERGESTEDVKQREKWEQNLEEFNELVGGVVGSLEEEIQRRKETEKSIRKFLLKIDPNKSLREQIMGWIEKEQISLSKEEMEKFIESAYAKYKERGGTLK